MFEEGRESFDQPTWAGASPDDAGTHDLESTGGACDGAGDAHRSVRITFTVTSVIGHSQQMLPVLIRFFLLRPTLFA